MRLVAGLQQPKRAHAGHAAHPPITFTVRASRHTCRRHSSVHTASDFLAAASLSVPASTLYMKFCMNRLRPSLRCFLLLFLMSAAQQGRARARVRRVRARVPRMWRARAALAPT